MRRLGSGPPAVRGCCFRTAPDFRDTRWQRDKKRRNLNDAKDGDIENTREAGIIILGGELGGTFMHMSNLNTYERLDHP
jgi:hypothetical protein